MKYNDFQNLKISTLGFGGMRFPTVDGKIDREQAQAMIDCAMKNGVNYYDTAFMYHGGESEVFFGEALAKYDRSAYFLADKMPPGDQKCREDLEKVFSTQLERCKTDYFDFYLMHTVTSGNYESFFVANNVVDFCLEKKREGKIRHFGFSFHGDAQLLERMLSEHDCFEFVQLQLNYYDFYRDDAAEIYEVARKHNMPIIIMEPVRGGLLARLNENACGIFKDYDSSVSVASWAIRYCFNLEGVVTVLSGMSEMLQVEDNLRNAYMAPLTEADYAVINKAIETFCREEFIPCTACRYCSECPQGIDIANIFDLKNRHSIESEWSRKGIVEKYAALETKADACIGCGYCVSKCPQEMDIPSLLAQVHDVLG